MNFSIQFVPTNHVIHVQGFSGNKQTAKKLAKTFPNLYFGLTPAIAQTSGQTALREMVKALPMDRILLESGAPYVIPKEFMVGRVDV